MSTTIHPLTHLNMHIHEMTENTSYMGKLWKTIKLVKNQHGYAAGTALSVGIAFASIYTATFSYFCLEGTARSIEETVVTYQEHGKIAQALGDAGGWSMLPIVSFFTFQASLKQLIREGEFAEVKQICEKWYQEIKQPSLEEFYVQINKVLDAIAPQCFLYKSVVNRKLIALSIVGEKINQEAPLNPSSELSLDLQLKPIYQQITEKQNHISYLHRMRSGLHAIRAKSGMRSMIANVISGIAIPILLGISSISSGIGEVQLGKKLFEAKEDLVEVGHFGEWPDNLVEALLAAFFLNKDLVLKGDIQWQTEMFQGYLNSLKTQSSMHNRLAEVANNEIQQLATTSFFSQGLQLDLFHAV